MKVFICWKTKASQIILMYFVISKVKVLLRLSILNSITFFSAFYIHQFLPVLHPHLQEQ